MLPPELLKAVADGDAALHALTRVELRAAWNRADGAPCALCAEGTPHTFASHTALLAEVDRELPRGHHMSSIDKAERAWHRATGEKRSIEDILRRTLTGPEPMSALKLSAVLTVGYNTIIRWARTLGLPVQDRLAWRTRARQPGPSSG